MRAFKRMLLALITDFSFAEILFSKYIRPFCRSASNFISIILGGLVNSLFEKVVKPLARRFVPRNVRTKLRSLDGKIFFRASMRRREFQLVAMRDVPFERKIDADVSIFPEVKVDCAVPRVFPSELKSNISLAAESYIFPAVSVLNIADARISSLSNFVELKGEVVHHDLYRFTHDYTSEELHGRIKIYPQRKSIKKIDAASKVEVLDVAAVFTDSCAPNYAHWLTEVLPRIHAGVEAGLSESVPFVIDSGLHSNIFSSAKLLAEKHRLIELQKESSLHVNNLYMVGSAGYIPFDRRPSLRDDYSHGMFSSVALKSMKAKLSSLLGPAGAEYPKKIILRRNSGARAMKNEERLALLLQDMGFSAVYPEKLTFEQQYHLFSGAECVVGATGAAMANLIFCQPSCRVIICISSHKSHSFGYWVNMASAVDNNITYVMGPVVGPRNQGIHADFVIDVNDVVKAINY